MASGEPEEISLRQALAATRRRLGAGGIEEPEIEAELLLREALRDQDGVPSRTRLFQRLEEPAPAGAASRLETLIQRRLAHEPSAYVLGRREFWGLELSVTPDVLIPRPETELLVERALAEAQRVPASIERHTSTNSQTSPATSGRSAGIAPIVVDVGTGSGAIAVALAKELPGATVYASDVSWQALAVARANAREHEVQRRVAFLHGDLLMPLPAYVDLIVANLPYVTSEDWTGLAPELREYEPRLALDGGPDGLELIRALLHQVPRYLRPGGSVCLEFGAGQSETILDCASLALPSASLTIFDDFPGIPRVLVARLP